MLILYYTILYYKYLRYTIYLQNYYNYILNLE